jgi:hypothetical protein
LTTEKSRSPEFRLRVKFTVEAVDADDVLRDVLEAFDKSGVSYEPARSRAVQLSVGEVLVGTVLRVDDGLLTLSQEQIEQILARSRIKAFNLLLSVTNP